MLAAFRSFFAAVIDCWSCVFVALARTSPGVTASPTFALTSATCQVPVGVDEPLDELGRAGGGAPTVGALPKARLQLVEAATEPVAATSSETSATLAAAVRYVVAAAVFRGRTPVPTTRAAPPTTRSTTIATTLSFMSGDCPPGWRHEGGAQRPEAGPGG